MSINLIELNYFLFSNYINTRVQEKYNIRILKERIKLSLMKKKIIIMNIRDIFLCINLNNEFSLKRILNKALYESYFFLNV
jgi:hypothetical protein